MNDVLFLVGRVLFAWLFLRSGVSHLQRLEGTAQYAASGGVPAPKVAVVVTGLMLLVGGLSILLGYEPRIGALVLVIFLVPTALIMHRYWGITDAMMAATQGAHFWKNIALAGAALMIYYCATVSTAPWPYSVGR
jgi:putative oxidoreductase